MTMTTQTTISPEHFREVMAGVATPVVIATGQPSFTDQPIAIVLGSFVSISLDPPLVGVFIDVGSTSWPKLRTSSEIVISVLADDHEDLCRKVARKEPNALQGSAWGTNEIGLPAVNGAVAQMICTVENESDAGDHFFVMLRVVDMHRGDGLPLLFHDRTYKKPAVCKTTA